MNKGLIFLTIFGFLLIFSAPVFADASIPLSYNATNTTWAWRSGAVLISANWSSAPNATWIEFTNISGTYNTSLIQCPDDTNRQVAAGINLTSCTIDTNWTNYTITPTYSQYGLGSNSFRIFVMNDTSPYNCTNVTSSLSFDLWTLANLSCVFDNYGHLISRAGGSYTVTCEVWDTLVSDDPRINASVLVNVSNNTAFMAGNTTNQSGWTSITFSTPTEASYTLVANMTNNTSIYVNVTDLFNASSIMFISNQYNPRPFVLTPSAVTVNYTYGGWGQLQPNYSFPLPFIVPNFTGGTFNGMILSSNIYAPLSYNSELFFKAPTRMEMFAYNLTFNVTYSSAGSQLINISTAMPEAPPAQWGCYKNQTLLPAKFVTFDQPDFIKFDNLSEEFTPPNMTVLMKNPDDFTINITNRSSVIVINGSQRYNITDMPAPNATFDQGKIVINFSGLANYNYTISILFGTQDISCFDEFPGGSQNFSENNFKIYCEDHAGDDPNAPPVGPPKTESTPAFITYQSTSGFNLFATDPGDAPLANVSQTSSFIVNVTNPLMNYTGDNLFAEFRYPLNITDWDGQFYNSTNTSFNISEDHEMRWWNETAPGWLELNSTTTPYVNTTEACTNITDTMPGSPMYNKNMTMCFKSMSFDLNQTVSNDETGTRLGLNKSWIYNANVRLKMTVTNSFKIIKKTNSTTGTQMGAAQSTNWYNATIAGGQAAGGSTGGSSAAQSNAGLFKFDDTLLTNLSRACAAGLTPATCPNISVYVNGQLYSNWTTGSLVITSQSSGAQSVSIRYSVPLVVGAPAQDGNGPGNGIIPPPSEAVKHSWVNIDPYTLKTWNVGSDVINVTKIEFMLNEEVAEGKLKIENYVTKPDAVTTPTDTVYQYLKITQTSMPDDIVENVTLTFVVGKDWITDNDLNKTTVTLNKYVDDEWLSLDTTLKSEDTEKITYSAITTGFSYFVITASALPGVVCEEDWSCPDWSTIECINGTQTRTCTDLNDCGTTVNKPAESQTCEIGAEVVGLPDWTVGAIAAVVIIVIVIFVFTQRKKIFKKKTQFVYKKSK